MGTEYEIHDLANRRRFELGKRYRARRERTNRVVIEGTSWYDGRASELREIQRRADAFCEAALWNTECVDDVAGWPEERAAWPVTESVYTVEEIAARESEPPRPAEDASAARVVAAARKLRAAERAEQSVLRACDEGWPHRAHESGGDETPCDRNGCPAAMQAAMDAERELDAALAAYDAAHTDAPGVA